MATVQDIKKPEDWVFYEFVHKCVNVHGDVYGRCAIAKKPEKPGGHYHAVLLIADSGGVIVGPKRNAAYAIGNLSKVEI